MLEVYFWVYFCCQNIFFNQLHNLLMGLDCDTKTIPLQRPLINVQREIVPGVNGLPPRHTFKRRLIHFIELNYQNDLN